MAAIGLGHYLVVAAALFTIGIFGIFLNRKNVIIILMSIELILLAVNINLVAFSSFLGDMTGQVFALLVLTVAAAEHRPAYGGLLALGYGLGRGLPFLLLGLFSGVATRLRCQPSWSRAIRVTTGSVLLVITGYYLWIFLRLG